MSEVQQPEWSAGARERIEVIRLRYPTARGAIMPVLWEALREFNHISDAVAKLVADTLEVPPIWVEEVVSFYVMYHTQAVGKHVIWMCRNLSCSLRGFPEIKEAIERHLGICEGETTPDGEFTLLSNECLGGCGGGPMIQIDHAYYENLTPQTVGQLLDRVKTGQVPEEA